MTSPSGTTTPMYVDSHYPLGLVQQLQSLRGTGHSGSPNKRHWMSYPRLMSDTLTEVVVVKFASVVSVSKISLDLLEISQSYSLWFRNAYGELQLIPDRSFRPFQGTISTGDVNAWYTVSKKIQPILASSIEVHLQRKPDDYIDPQESVSLGVRRLLIKRETFSRGDAVTPWEKDVDPMGNLVERFVKDWDPPKAMDGASYTFWKSEPQPDPDAVVNFYLDVRDSNGNAQRIDRLWLDPAYTGQSMNLYFSNDETIGQRRLNLSRVTPSATNNAPQTIGVGLDLTTTNAFYSVPFSSLGLLPGTNVWVAGCWSPSFDSGTPPSVNLDIFTNDLGTFHLRYLSTLKQFEVKWGTTTGTVPVPNFYAGQLLNFSVRVVFPGNLNSLAPGMYLDVRDGLGNVLVNSSLPFTPLSQPYGTSLSFNYNGGILQQLFVKQDAPLNSDVASALQDIVQYMTPDPSTQVQQDGTLPTSSITNMVYAANFLVDQLGYGGLDDNFFTSKAWAPQWVDWTVKRGFYYFPQPISAKYLKLEFSKLTEEPYPIWESGVKVKYLTFPVDVLKTSISIFRQNWDFYTQQNSQFSSTRGLVFNNYYTRSSYTNSTQNLPKDIQVTVGKGNVTDTVPRIYDQPISTTVQRETTSSEINTYSTSTNSTRIAADAYYTVVSGDWLIKIGARYNIPWQQIYQANRGVIDTDPRVGMLPLRSPGWWIFPGQALRIPNAIMEQITNTQTVTEKKVSSTTTTTTRTRFTTTSIHRYEVRQVERDSAIAYFAGINEVRVYKLSYLTEDDTLQYNWQTLDTSHFNFNNMVGYTSGAWASVPPSVSTNTPSGVWSDTVATWSDEITFWGSDNSGYQTGSVISNTLPSTKKYRKITFTPFDRGLYSQIDGLTLNPIGVETGPTGFWSSSASKWSDTTTTWGAGQPLVSMSTSNKYFMGKNALYLSRVAGQGVAGVSTQNFPILHNARVRVSCDYFRTSNTNNTLYMQLIDNSNPASEQIVLQYQCPNPVWGQWANFTSYFSTNSISRASCYIKFLIQGPDAEQIYVGRVVPQTSTIVYEFSNDNGAHYTEATEVAYNPGSELIFPDRGNQMKIRITLYDPKDFIYGAVVTPYYL